MACAKLYILNTTCEVNARFAQRTLQACTCCTYFHVMLSTTVPCQVWIFLMPRACSDTPVVCFFWHSLSHVACDEALHSQRNVWSQCTAVRSELSRTSQSSEWVLLFVMSPSLLLMLFFVVKIVKMRRKKKQGGELPVKTGERSPASSRSYFWKCTTTSSWVVSGLPFYRDWTVSYTNRFCKLKWRLQSG